MQHTSFADMTCPIARSLERVGEWWSILILRDAFRGMRRFDEFRESLGVAPNILTRRLNVLVEAGLLRRELYCERPPRHEYVLTERGEDFQPILFALLAFGNRHFPRSGDQVVLVDLATGEEAEPELVDARTGKAMTHGLYAAADKTRDGTLRPRRPARRQPAGKGAAS